MVVTSAERSSGAVQLLGWEMAVRLDSCWQSESVSEITAPSMDATFCDVEGASGKQCAAAVTDWIRPISRTMETASLRLKPIPTLLNIGCCQKLCDLRINFHYYFGNSFGERFLDDWAQYNQEVTGHLPNLEQDTQTCLSTKRFHETKMQSTMWALNPWRRNWVMRTEVQRFARCMTDRVRHDRVNRSQSLR